ncbi:hydrophobic surface binding protein A-domain-containing protein [Boeremia exigua]|uniref:hydrophobic surface binding protein A-domain-containing protein n=1 Tax=Boeremia exigua TaxID=749465 RepID=UPI001E8DA314|nr:hydrophobic surface binding protein A-domain-containing protein [Boeremia exigua]KAH6629290.1 hydrophobic surface binding protein A-domain-containing protein [Boeremia exigua]
MQFSILFASLLAISSALPVEPRQEQSLAPQLLTTINDLNTAVTGLTTAVNKFDGSLFGLLPQALAVVKAEAKLDVTILKATYITGKSANFTAEESTNIVNTLAGGIGPIQTSLDALKGKYPAFKKTFTAPIVLLDLKILKKHTDDLIAALTLKVTAENAGLLGLGKGILDQSFDDAIAVYSA